MNGEARTHHESGDSREDSGKFAIPAKTVLPPPVPEQALRKSPDELAGDRSGSTAPLGTFGSSTPAPPGEVPSGMRPSQARDADEGEVDEELSALLQPEPDDEERVDLRFQDMSVALGNRFAASSLVPAATERRGFPWGVALLGILVGAGLTAALVAARLTLMVPDAEPAQPASAERSVASPSDKAPRLAPLAEGETEPDPGSGAETVSGTEAEAAAEAVSGDESASETAAAFETAAAPQAAADSASQTSTATGAAAVAATERETAGEIDTERVAGAANETERVSDAPAKPAVQGAEIPSAEAAAAEPAEPAAEATPLPLTPTREQVAAAFESVRPALQRCADGQSGVARIDATILGSGRVAHALIQGDFQGTPAGSCMAREVRKASLPPFQQPKMTVQYPVAL